MSEHMPGGLADLRHRASRWSQIAAFMTNSGRTRQADTGLRAAISSALDGRRFFLLLPFGTMCGLILYVIAPAEPRPTAILAVGLALIGSLILLRDAQGTVRGIVLGLAFWLGFTLLPLHGALFGTPMLAYPVFGTYEATVDEILSDDLQGRRRIVISAITPVGEARAIDLRRARLLIKGQNPPLSVGDRISAAMRLAPVPGPIKRDGYDSQFHAYFDGLGSYGNVTSGLRVIAVGKGGFMRTLDEFRRTISNRIATNLDEPASGIARALIVGDQSAIDDDTRNMMATAGLAHVLAISGLHLTLVAGGIFAAIRIILATSTRAAALWPVKNTAAVVGILTAIGYLLISGMSIPAIRSTIMLGLVFGAVVFGRQALTMRNVAFAALAILITDPSNLFGPGFQLSFAAVAALIGIYELTSRPTQEGNQLYWRVPRFLAGVAITSLIAGAATALFAAYHFQQTSPLGVLGNLGALPLVGFVIMPSGFLGVMMMPLGLEQPFFWLMGWGIDRMLEVAFIVSTMSSGLNAHPLLNSNVLPIGMAAFAWFVFFANRWRFLGPLLAVPAILLFGLAQQPDVLMADTTQAVVVRSGDSLSLMRGRNGTFAVRVWEEAYGEKVAARANDVHCDRTGCFADIPDRYAIAIILDQSAFEEDCRLADLVITKLVAPPGCRLHTQVVDQSDFQSGGAQWLHWNPAERSFLIIPAIIDPKRPWRPQR